MNATAQRIAIAKALGIELQSDGIKHHLMPCGKKTEREPEGCLLKECPDYLHSLDAMHEAEKVLTDEQYNGTLFLCHDDDPSYRNRLRRITDNATPADTAVRYESATAAQRAEAFLKCLGLWVP